MALWLIILLSVCGILVLAFLVTLVIANIEISAFLVNGSWSWRKFNWKDGPLPEPKDEAERKKRENEKQVRSKAEKWLADSAHEDLFLQSGDGLKLHAALYRQNAVSHKWVICVHGYRGSIKNTACYGMNFFAMGFNVLLPENRGVGSKGQSEGKKLGMGWLDKNDIRLWIDKVTALDPDAKIVLHGESMGSATVMMLTGEPLPQNIVCAVSDCGYTSVWDEFMAVRNGGTRRQRITPDFVLATLVCKLRVGYFFKEASSVDMLRKSVTPTYFVHGGADGFVPTWMLIKNYKACAAEKKDWYVFPGAAHCESQFVNPPLYWQKVWEFVDKFVG